MVLDYDLVRNICDAWLDGRDKVLAPGRHPDESLGDYIIRVCVRWLLDACWQPVCQCDCHD